MRKKLGLLNAVTITACVGTAMFLGSCEGTLSSPVGEGVAVNLEGDRASDSIARRLSRVELGRTLLLLLGDDSGIAGRRLSADETSPFDNNYERQLVSTALIESLGLMAQEISEATIADTAKRNSVVGCTPASNGDEVCFRSFLESFLFLAFRRPLREGEVDRYMTLLSFATEVNQYVDNDFYTAVALAIESVIQDPEFLYRIEIGFPDVEENVVNLNAHEMATRISFLIWGSAPDKALLDAATSGGLDTAEQRAEAVTRLLADDRAKSQFRGFHSMWMGYRSIPVSAALATNLSMETNALIDRVLFENNGSYFDLFTSDETYLNTELANHYGLPAPDGGEGWVSYGPGERAGILSHGTVLSGFSKLSDTSPTQRGIFIRELLMCDTIPPPPPDVDADAAPTGGPEAVCKKDRYIEHVRNSACAGCHTAIDPIGFGLERYGIGGAFRTTDIDNSECVIDGEGELPGFGTFSGPAELGQKLVENDLIQSCFTQRLHEYALGRDLNAADREAVDTLTTLLADGEYNFGAFLRSYVSRKAFGQKRAPIVTEE